MPLRVLISKLITTKQTGLDTFASSLPFPWSKVGDCDEAVQRNEFDWILEKSSERISLESSPGRFCPTGNSCFRRWKQRDASTVIAGINLYRLIIVFKTLSYKYIIEDCMYWLNFFSIRLPFPSRHLHFLFWSIFLFLTLMILTF